MKLSIEDKHITIHRREGDLEIFTVNGVLGIKVVSLDPHVKIEVSSCKKFAAISTEKHDWIDN